jgi:phosphoenolpyruvate---glycerone phosphotransferase subunit DhaL
MISTLDMRAFLKALGGKLAEHQDLLDFLDAGAGDGDHGATMVMGFRRVLRIADQDYDTPAQLIKAAGRAFAGVGGSIGPLWGMGMLRAAQTAEGRPRLDGRDVARALLAAAQAAAETGRSQPGDRTLLDAAVPAAQAFAASIDGGSDTAEAARAGWRAALEGARATAVMTAARGRASRNPSLAAGRVDPGCASVALAWTVAACPEDEQSWLDLLRESR